jgi:hypothetical protein
MGTETIRVAATGGTPGADANTYKMFDSTVTFTGGSLRSHDISRINFTIQNNQTGTLNAYWSANRGVTWNQYDSRAVPIPGAGLSNGPYSYLVDTYEDWKLDWVNGGSAQTVWRPDIIMIRNDRASGV